MKRHDPRSPATFTFPLLTGRPVDFHPEVVYDNSFGNAKFGTHRVGFRKRGKSAFDRGKGTTVTSCEIVTAAIEFKGPERLPRDFPAPFGSDFAGMGMTPSPDMRPPNGKGTDE